MQGVRSRSSCCHVQARASPHVHLQKLAPAPARVTVLPQLAQQGAACLAASLVLCSAAAADPAAVQSSFATKCAGCHVGGGNIVQPSATLFTPDLQRNGLDGPDALYSLIYSGKGRMPGFGTDCAPRGACTFGPRLSDEEVRELAQYVLDQAAVDWK